MESEDQDAHKRKEAKKRYVDLCNEQLFYFGKGYLPREVIEEWLDGMIDYLPQLDNKTGEVRSEHAGNVEAELLEGYPRIKRAFTVDGPYDLTSKEQRRALVRRVRKRVRAESRFVALVRSILRLTYGAIQNVRLGAHRKSNKE